MRKSLAIKRMEKGFKTMAAAAKDAGLDRQIWTLYETSDLWGKIPTWNKIQKALGIPSAEMWDLINDIDGKTEDGDKLKVIDEDTLKGIWKEKGFIDFAKSDFTSLCYRVKFEWLERGRLTTYDPDYQSHWLYESFIKERVSYFYAGIAAKIPAGLSQCTGIDVLRANTEEQIKGLEKDYKAFYLDIIGRDSTARSFIKSKVEEILESALGLDLIINMQAEGEEITGHKVMQERGSKEEKSYAKGMREFWEEVLDRINTIEDNQ